MWLQGIFFGNCQWDSCDSIILHPKEDSEINERIIFVCHSYMSHVVSNWTELLMDCYGFQFPVATL